MKKETSYIVAEDGEKIAVHSWLPETPPTLVIQISHGMAEFAMRYDRFAAQAVKNGYAVYASDHRGHGQTAATLDRLGYLADGDGFTRVVEDLHLVSLHIKKTHPALSLFLLAHSFGSFIAQQYIETYGAELAGCILTGTAGPRGPLVSSGKLLANLAVAIRGRYKKSPMLTDISFGSYNKGIKKPASSNSWLSRDTREVEAYDATPWAGFICTTGFYQDLMRGLSRIHRAKAIQAIPKELPILLASGKADPVGNYGKTVSALANIYRLAGINHVSLTLYDGARHEILNETNRDEVTSDILAWIKTAQAAIR